MAVAADRAASRARRATVVWSRRFATATSTVRAADAAADTGGRAQHRRLARGNAYDFGSIVWSPDSKKIAASRQRPGYRRKVHYVESSPADQLQPKTFERFYAKPGDALDLAAAGDLRRRCDEARSTIDNTLFPNPYKLSALEWRKDSRALTFEYNQRGHQVYRVIEVDAATGQPRAVISEEPKTFFNYNRRTATRRLGQEYRSRRRRRRAKSSGCRSATAGTTSISTTARTGTVKNQITKGEWVVRGVEQRGRGEAADLCSAPAA